MDKSQHVLEWGICGRKDPRPQRGMKHRTYLNPCKASFWSHGDYEVQDKRCGPDCKQIPSVFQDAFGVD